jgi:dihydrofolate synthase / folylpolyglutamate synthase
MYPTAEALLPPKSSETFMAYQDALQWLFNLTRFGEKLDLSAPRALNHALGDPLSHFKSALIGGTNGKGSTCAYLSALGRISKRRVGRFTSPHLISFRERITVEDALISHDDVIKGVQELRRVTALHDLRLSFFEATWGLAAWHFARSEVEWVIWEVGLGGRLDATNVCDPLLSGISSIGLDHTHILGETLPEIASEKSAIYRPGRPAFSSAEGMGAQALQEATSVSISFCAPLSEEVMPDTADFQRANASLAWAMSQSMGWSAQQSDLNTVAFPGRLEEFNLLWLDCAHNPSAVERLIPWFRTQTSTHPTSPIHIIFGSSQDKDVKESLGILIEWVSRITWVSPQSPRCLTAQQLIEAYEAECREMYKRVEPKPTRTLEFNITPRVDEALDQRDRDAITLVLGSCYLIGEARAHLLGVHFPELGLITTAR